MQLTLNEDLLHRAQQVTGFASDQELLEYGLRLIIAFRSINIDPKTTTGKRKVGKASVFLGEARFEEADEPSVYTGPPLTLDDMQQAVTQEAMRHK